MYAAVLRSGLVVEADTEEEVHAAGRAGDPVVSFGARAALLADPEIAAARERQREAPEAKAARRGRATVEELAAELLAGRDRPAVIAALRARLADEDAPDGRVVGR